MKQIEQASTSGKIGKKDYDFDLKRDRNFSSIIFSHLSRLNNYHNNKQELNQMYDSQYECVRRIAGFIDYPPIPDGQIESLRHENRRINARQKIDEKTPLWGALLTNIITGYLAHRNVKVAHTHNVLEIGTFTGLTSAYIAKRNPNHIIDTLEIDEDLVHRANMNYDALGLHNVDSYHSDYLEWDLSPYDVIFKDGLHKGQANIDLVRHIISIRNDKPTLIVFDDVRWSWDMLLAWNLIKAMPEVNVSIDCYHIGAILVGLPRVEKESYKYSLPGLLPR